MTRNYFDLTGQVAVVTGCSTGLGVQMAKALASQGCNIAALARRKDKIDAVASEIEKEFGVKAVGIQCDITSTEMVDAAIDETLKVFGRIDILINNAGTGAVAPAEDITDDQFNDEMNIDLFGTFRVARSVAKKAMIPAKYGRIINIGSMRGLDCPHFPFYPESMGDQSINYTTEKWAMVGMTKYMAGRYGKDGIRVNCIAPGGYNPKVSEDTAGGFAKTYIENCPLHRWADEDDIKGPVTFLASDASAYVTGATLVMDGGWTIW